MHNIKRRTSQAAIELTVVGNAARAVADKPRPSLGLTVDAIQAGTAALAECRAKDEADALTVFEIFCRMRAALENASQPDARGPR